MTNWGASALSILLFPIIKDNLPGKNPAPMFLFFAVWSSLAWIVNSKYVVETKDKSASQIKSAYMRLEGKWSFMQLDYFSIIKQGLCNKKFDRKVILK